jgi:hypothetical protein
LTNGEIVVHGWLTSTMIVIVAVLFPGRLPPEQAMTFPGAGAPQVNPFVPEELSRVTPAGRRSSTVTGTDGVPPALPTVMEYVTTLPDVVDGGLLVFATVRSAGDGVNVIVGVNVGADVLVDVAAGTLVFVGTGVPVGTAVPVGIAVFEGVLVIVGTPVNVRVNVTVGLDGVDVAGGTGVAVDGTVPPTLAELPGNPHSRLDAPNDWLAESSGITTAQMRPPVPGRVALSRLCVVGCATTAIPSVPRL